MKYARNPSSANMIGGPSRRKRDVWTKKRFSKPSMDAARSAFSFVKKCLASSYISQTDITPIAA